MFIDLNLFIRSVAIIFSILFLFSLLSVVLDIILEMDETQQKSISGSTNIISIFMRVVQLKV